MAIDGSRIPMMPSPRLAGGRHDFWKYTEKSYLKFPMQKGLFVYFDTGMPGCFGVARLWASSRPTKFWAFGCFLVRKLSIYLVHRRRRWDHRGKQTLLVPITVLHDNHAFTHGVFKLPPESWMNNIELQMKALGFPPTTYG